MKLLLILLICLPPSSTLFPLIQANKELADRKIKEKEYHIDGYLELNHVYSEYGRHALDQYIIWKWYPDLGEHHIACWYIANNGRVRLSDEEFDKRLRQWLRDNKLSEIPNGDDPECYVDRSDWAGDRRFVIKRNKDKGITFITNKYNGHRLTFYLKSRVESVTFYDKEVADREKLPTDKRFLPGN